MGFLIMLVWCSRFFEYVIDFDVLFCSDVVFGC